MQLYWHICMYNAVALKAYKHLFWYNINSDGANFYSYTSFYNSSDV